MSSNKKPTTSNPISIVTHNRPRSFSFSSTSSETSSEPEPEHDPITPVSPTQPTNIPLPSTSPILSYFLAQSPKAPSTTAAFPFKRRFGAAPLFEDEEPEKEIPVATHARRASVTVASRFSQSPTLPFSDAMSERGTNVLRRLSLSKPLFDTATQAPAPPPPNTAVSPTPEATPFANKPRRSATISTDGRTPHRPPSPMGERILKGHFDGFN